MLRKNIKLYSLLLLLLPNLLYAQVETHDGFFLRFDLGSGSGTLINEATDSGSQKHAGSDTLINIQLGWSWNENLVLHVGHSSSTANNTTRNFDSVEIYGVKNVPVESSEYEVNTTTLGISYYFMPLNFYISPEYRFDGKAETKSTVAESLSLRLNDHYKFGSGTGFGLTLGKEWWVSENWGLGLAVFYYRDTFKAISRGVNVDGPAFGSGSGITYGAKDIEGRATHSVLGLTFSATYN